MMVGEKQYRELKALGFEVGDDNDRFPTLLVPDGARTTLKRCGGVYLVRIVFANGGVVTAVAARQAIKIKTEGDAAD
jgi:hypothetical protein